MYAPGEYVPELGSREPDVRRHALGAIVRRHTQPVYSVCLRMVGSRDAAQDLSQDVLTRVIGRISDFDGRSRLGTWIVRIAMNVCLSWLRAQRHRRHASLDGEASGAAIGDARRATGHALGSSPTTGEQRDEHARVRAALEAIDDDSRAIIVMRDVRGLSYDDIAAAFGVPIGTVRSRLFRARRALRDAFDARAGLTATDATGARA